jgi:uncharacterized protein YbjT (DUF2867 family)
MGGSLPDRGRKCFLVTGACGGLGTRVTELLVTSGALVFAADRDEPGLSRMAASLFLIPVSMDVTSRASVARRLDGVVCAAGVFAGGPLVELAEQEVQNSLECARPKPRYRVGNDPLRALLAALPATWADALIRGFLWPPVRDRRVRRPSR